MELIDEYFRTVRFITKLDKDSKYDAYELVLPMENYWQQIEEIESNEDFLCWCHDDLPSHYIIPQMEDIAFKVRISDKIEFKPTRVGKKFLMAMMKRMPKPQQMSSQPQQRGRGRDRDNEVA